MYTKTEDHPFRETKKSIIEVISLRKQKVNVAYRKEWLKKMEFLASISEYYNAVILLYDTSLNRFLYRNDKTKIQGNYSHTDFTSETGVNFYLSNIHPDQRRAALLIQLKITNYVIEHSALDLNNNIVSNILFLYKKKEGGYIQFLQKMTAVKKDAVGHPLLYLMFGFDISHLVKPSVGLIINGIDETIIWTYNIKKQSLEKGNLFSRQEKKVLSLLVQGKSSKEIAHMLFISSHTIDTYRRKLLKKTKCIDSTALITFAKMTGLI